MKSVLHGLLGFAAAEQPGAAREPFVGGLAPFPEEAPRAVRNVYLATRYRARRAVLHARVA